VWRYVLHSSCSQKGPVAGSCEHSNKPLGSKKGLEISWLAERLLAPQEWLLHRVSQSVRPDYTIGYWKKINLSCISLFSAGIVILLVSLHMNKVKKDSNNSVDRCSANFFQTRHTLICQRHMPAHQKVSPHEKGVRNYTWPHIFISLPCKTAGICCCCLWV
jgi:hypothetical protein